MSLSSSRVIVFDGVFTIRPIFSFWVIVGCEPKSGVNSTAEAIAIRDTDAIIIAIFTLINGFCR